MNLTAVVRDPYSAGFFDGTSRGVLTARRCENGHFMAPVQGSGGPALRCHTCQSAIITWEPVSGEATLVSWAVVHLALGQGQQVVGIVELAEGPWMNVLLDVGMDADLFVGRALTVAFVPTEGGEVIPAFRPA